MNVLRESVLPLCVLALAACGSSDRGSELSAASDGVTSADTWSSDSSTSAPDGTLADAGTPEPGPKQSICGDNICGPGENCESCFSDCGQCPWSCGDGTCNVDENGLNCPEDCGEFIPTCGDGDCNGGESTINCVDDCGTSCGDGVCNGFESKVDCPSDCEIVCGDGVCILGVENCGDCPGDCLCSAGQTCTENACVDDTPPDTVPDLPDDLSGVVWLHEDVSQWQTTATLEAVTFQGPHICLDFNKTGVWEGVELNVDTEVNANAWIFVYQQGTWYAAAWEVLRKNQTCKSMSAVAGDHIGINPLQNFKPIIGQTYYFMVSGLAKEPGIANVQERSNAVKVVWPAPAKGIFDPQRSPFWATGDVSCQGNRFVVGGETYYPKTDFVTGVSPGDDWKKWSSLFYLSRNTAERKTIRNALVAGQYNSIYLYTLNQDVISVTPYGNGGFSLDTTQLNPDRVNQWIAAIDELLAAELKPFIWLAGENSPEIAGMSLGEWEVYVDHMVAAFESQPILWVMGSEVDTYWSSEQVEERRAYLMNKTAHPVGVHLSFEQSKSPQTPYQDGFDFVMGQFGSPQTNAQYVQQVKAYTISGKPYVAAEFNVADKGSGAEAESTVTARSRSIGVLIASQGDPPLVAGIGNGITLVGGSPYSPTDDPGEPEPTQQLKGIVEGVVELNGVQTVTGWACHTGWSGSIFVHLHMGGPVGPEEIVKGALANETSEQIINLACLAEGGGHRFEIPLTDQELDTYAGKAIYVRGISPVGNGNHLLTNSGIFMLPGDEGVAETGSPGFDQAPIPAPPSSTGNPPGLPSLTTGLAGTVDALVEVGGVPTLTGWACHLGWPGSIDVHVYVDGAAGEGIFLKSAVANAANEQAVTDACKADGAYRFELPLTNEELSAHAGKPIYVQAFSPVGGTTDLLGNAGSFKVPVP